MSQDNLNLNVESMDDLLNALMEDLPDLPPMGVPPSGNYNLTVTWDVKKIGDDNKEVIAAEYIVEDINELKNEDEAGEVVRGMKFSEFFHLRKKDGTTNTFGLGKMKQRLQPFAAHFETQSIGETINSAKQITIAATVKRTINKNNPDQFNMDLKDVVVL